MEGRAGGNRLRTRRRTFSSGGEHLLGGEHNQTSSSVPEETDEVLQKLKLAWDELLREEGMLLQARRARGGSARRGGSTTPVHGAGKGGQPSRRAGQFAKGRAAFEKGRTAGTPARGAEGQEGFDGVGTIDGEEERIWEGSCAGRGASDSRTEGAAAAPPTDGDPPPRGGGGENKCAVSDTHLFSARAGPVSNQFLFSQVELEESPGRFVETRSEGVATSEIGDVSDLSGTAKACRRLEFSGSISKRKSSSSRPVSRPRGTTTGGSGGGGSPREGRDRRRLTEDAGGTKKQTCPKSASPSRSKAASPRSKANNAPPKRPPFPCSGPKERPPLPVAPYSGPKRPPVSCSGPSSSSDPVSNGGPPILSSSAPLSKTSNRSEQERDALISSLLYDDSFLERSLGIRHTLRDSPRSSENSFSSLSRRRSECSGGAPTPSVSDSSPLTSPVFPEQASKMSSGAGAAPEQEPMAAAGSGGFALCGTAATSAGEETEQHRGRSSASTTPQTQSAAVGPPAVLQEWSDIHITEPAQRISPTDEAIAAVDVVLETLRAGKRTPPATELKAIVAACGGHRREEEFVPRSRSLSCQTAPAKGNISVQHFASEGPKTVQSLARPLSVVSRHPDVVIPPEEQPQDEDHLPPGEAPREAHSSSSVAGHHKNSEARPSQLPPQEREPKGGPRGPRDAPLSSRSSSWPTRGEGPPPSPPTKSTQASEKGSEKGCVGSDADVVENLIKKSEALMMDLGERLRENQIWEEGRRSLSL